MKPRFRLRSATIQRIVVAACASSLAALALIVWSLLDPGPVAVIAAMSAGDMPVVAADLATVTV